MIEFTSVSKVYDNGTRALSNVSLRVDKGEFVFVVGPSGAGKSTFIKLILREETPTKGIVTVNGYNLNKIKKRQIPQFRRSLGVVFQDFRLIPQMTVYDNVAFALRVTNVANRSIRQRVPYVLGLVGLAAKARNYPDQLSGGEQQRVALARALVNNPPLLIADEPTTALDVTVQAQVLELLKDLQKKLNTAILLITHNLGVVWEMCDTVMVMYAGNTVEYADTKTLYKEPLHPYTWGLLDSMPKLSSSTKEDLKTIPGTPPDLRLTGHCCNFYNRCPYATEICRQQVPPLKEVAPGHFVACHRQDGEHRLTRGEVNVTCKKM